MPHKACKDGYISVTQALDIISKPGLYYWFAKNGWEECQRIKKEAQEMGTLVHESIHRLFLDQQLTTADPNVVRMTSKFFKEFVDEYEVTPVILEPEEPWINHELKVQGTPDAVIKTNRGLMIADWKTSSQLDKISVPLQLAAYSFLCPDGFMEKGVAVRLDKKEDKLEIKWYDNLGLHLDYFKKCLELAHYIKGHIK